MEGELASVQSALADHRQRIGTLKRDTEAHLATAEKVESEADAKERALAEVRHPRLTCSLLSPYPLPFCICHALEYLAYIRCWLIRANMQ